MSYQIRRAPRPAVAIRARPASCGHGRCRWAGGGRPAQRRPHRQRLHPRRRSHHRRAARPSAGRFVPEGPGGGWTVAAVEPGHLRLLTRHGPVRGVPPFTDVPVRATTIASRLVTGHGRDSSARMDPEIRSWPILIAHHPGCPWGDVPPGFRPVAMRWAGTFGPCHAPLSRSGSGATREGRRKRGDRAQAAGRAP